MKVTRRTISTGVTALAVLILAAAIPSAVRDALETGRVYLFSQQFLDELPQRLTGPGRLRFLLQPMVAILLGWRAGLGDAREGRPPYLLDCLSAGWIAGSCCAAGWRPFATWWPLELSWMQWRNC